MDLQLGDPPASQLNFPVLHFASGASTDSVGGELYDALLAGFDVAGVDLAGVDLAWLLLWALGIFLLLDDEIGLVRRVALVAIVIPENCLSEMVLEGLLAVVDPNFFRVSHSREKEPGTRLEARVAGPLLFLEPA